MTVFVFIVESGNTESFDLEFEKREILNVIPSKYNKYLDIEYFDKMVSDIASRFEDEVFVTFVDQQYQIKYYYTDEGKRELERLENLERNENQVRFCNCNWMEYFPHFEGLDDSSNYIFASKEEFINVYDMANFLQIPINNNCYFIWNIKSLEEVSLAKSYYNIFSNTKRKNQIDSLGNKVTEDEESLKWIVEYGVQQIKGLIKAGVLNKERFIQKMVESWVLNVHSYFSSGIIIEFDMIPQPPKGEESKILKGLTPQEAFNEDCQYRYNIADRMCRCLCKYGLEFEKLATINNNPHTVNFDFLLN